VDVGFLEKMTGVLSRYEFFRARKLRAKKFIPCHPIFLYKSSLAIAQDTNFFPDFDIENKHHNL
jgi:hypothetical protein